jgi:hypothetical protein
VWGGAASSVVRRIDVATARKQHAIETVERRGSSIDNNASAAAGWRTDSS